MTIEMINKNKFRVASDKKLLRKIGKQWVVVGTLALVLLGGGAVITTTVTHADTNSPAVEAQHTNNVKTQLNSNLDKAYQATQSASGSSVASSKASSASASSANKPSNVESKANNMHDALLQNATAKTSSSLTNVNSAKSSVASNGSTSSKPSFNSAYQSYMAKMSGTDSKVASANDSNAQSNNENIKKPLLKDTAQPNYFSGNVIKTGNDLGLNYKVYQNGGVEFTDGTANSDLSDFSNSDVRKAKAIKFDDDIDTSNVTNMMDMFYGDNNLQSLDLGNKFDTSNVTNMNHIFDKDKALQSLDLGNKFDTSNVTNMGNMFNGDKALPTNNIQYIVNKFDTGNVTDMGGMFSGDNNIRSLNLGNFDTSNVTNMHNMFNGDKALQSLDLGNKFDTSNVTNMGNMFNGDKALQSLDLGNKFDTSNVTNMNQMFESDGSDNGHLILVVKSPKTGFSSNSGIEYLGLHKVISETDPYNQSYTSVNQAYLNYDYFNYDNVGTFISKINIPYILIKYAYKGRIMSSQSLDPVSSAKAHFNGDGYNDIYLTSDNADVPINYHLASNVTLAMTGSYSKDIKGNQSIKPSIYLVPILPNKVWTTIEYVTNKGTVGTYIANNYKDSIQSDVNHIYLTPNNESELGLPNGYHLSNNYTPIMFNNDVSTVSVEPNSDTNIIHYHDIYDSVDGLKTPNDTTETGQPSDKTILSAPNGWTFVNSDGSIANGTNNVNNNTKSFQYNRGNQTLDIAPVYKGMAYKYDKNNNSIEFTAGKCGNLRNFIQQAPAEIKNAQSIIFSNNVDGRHIIQGQRAFAGDTSLKNIVFNNSFNTRRLKSKLMFFSSGNLQSITIQSSDTKFSWVSVLPKMYKQLSDNGHGLKDAHGYYYTASTPNDFNRGNVGTFVRTPNLLHSIVHFHDVYSDIDGMKAPSDVNKSGNVDSNYTVTNPSGWAIVNPYGEIANGKNNIQSESKTFPIGQGNQTINVAPEDDGLVYKYNKGSNTVEFTGGTANNDLSGFSMMNPTVQHAKEMIFDDNVDIPEAANMNGMFKSDSNLTKMVIKSNKIKFPNNSSINSGFNPDSMPTLSESQKQSFDSELSGIINSGLSYMNLTMNSTLSALNNAMGGFLTQQFGKQAIAPYMNHPLNAFVVNPWYKQLPKQDENGNNYTSSTANNFSKGNTGVFVRPAYPWDNKGDMVVGTAFLTLLYKKGNHTDGQILRLHINGNTGDSDIVINPQDYDKPGYQVSNSSAWHIPFDYNDVKHTTNDFSRYNVENTFTYQAYQIPINITYFDTQTNNKLSSDNLGKIAYDGDTIDLQDTNSSNGIVSVDGNNYRLNLPTGYHLAHSNNYIKVTANGTYTKQVPNGVGGYRSVRMPLMKLTLGITPHFRKPTSNSSVTPMKPSSARSVTPQSASSASTEPSSASTVPSSASQSQSVAPSTSTASSMTAPSSTASVSPVTPNVTPSFVTSTKSSSAQPGAVTPASVSVKPSSISTNKTIARSVIRHASHKHVTKKRVRKPITKKHVIKPTTHHINHKKMAKHDSKRLNHQVTQDKHKLNTVERHMEARKATEIKMAHMLVHAKKTIKRSKHKLTYLRHNKRHVKHALRRITRNKVAIKHAKRVVRSIKQARPRFVHAKAASVEPTTDESAATSVKVPVITPKVHAKSKAIVHTSRKKLPQTSEATDHAGIVAIVLMVMSVILAGFDKAFSRKHNE